MTKAILLGETGGPEVLRWEEIDVGEPGPGQVRIRQSAVGLNYIDVYQRTGLYPVPLPGGLGVEAAGVIEVVGPGVDVFKVGDRVAYAGGPPGAYAQDRLVAASTLVKLPDTLSDQQAAAVLLQGMTAEFLIRRAHPVRSGETVLFHAAAGGVGLIACQWLRSLGATVIGTVGTDEKAELAASNGCTHPIVYTRENVVERVRALTGGAGVSVVYDSVGRDTWESSLDCLAPRGLMVSFGNSSGPVAPFSIGQLAAKGSLYVTRPTLAAYVSTPSELSAAAAEVFRMVENGTVRADVRQTYALKDAAHAHRDLESRRTVGSTVLLP